MVLSLSKEKVIMIRRDDVSVESLVRFPNRVHETLSLDAYQ